VSSRGNDEGRKETAVTNDATRGTIRQDEQRFREIGERFVRCTDPVEAGRLKSELVQALLRGQHGRQQHTIREWAMAVAER
jgi:hypothetical protein